MQEGETEGRTQSSPFSRYVCHPRVVTQSSPFSRYVDHPLVVTQSSAFSRYNNNNNNNKQLLTQHMSDKIN